MILAGDIGGTNTRLALFEDDITPVKGTLTKYPSSQFKTLEEILDRYMDDLPTLAPKVKKIKIKQAGFGVAGPVRDGKVKTTNLPWHLDAKKLSKKIGVKSTGLVNDLYATAAGIEVLPKNAFEVIRKGNRPKSGGTRAVVAPGTGLGHASLIWTGKTHIINPAEAGHIEFGPANDVEARLRDYIAAKDDPSQGFFKRCSYENVLSGPGLVTIYNFLVEKEKLPAHDLVTNAEPKDRAGVISQCGQSASNLTCAKALEIFTSVFGRQAGNFVLSVLALDGVYLGGGIPPKMLPLLRTPRFLDAFDAKGSQTWVQEVPIMVITNDLCGLYGAANVATQV